MVVSPMTAGVSIPADFRELIEAHYQKKLLHRFGEPPLPEEELAFIDEILDGGVTQVPLPDGSEVTVADAGGPGASEIVPSESDQSAAGYETKRVKRKWLALVIIPVAAVMLFGNPLRWFSRSDRTTAEGDGPQSQADEVVLPERDLDAIVTSGGEKGLAIAPRSVEISVGTPAAYTSTTFVVVPVEVKEAAWPCPEQKDEQPVACWIRDTLVNYLIGLPRTDQTADMARLLKGYGGEIRLRISTGDVLRFADVQVATVGRHETEVLAQDGFGITIPLLNGEGAQRTVIVGRYSAVGDLGGGGFAHATPALSTERTIAVQLGDVAALGALLVLPYSTDYSGGESRLSLLVHNKSPQPLVVESWSVRANGQNGQFNSEPVQPLSLVAGEQATVHLVVSGVHARSWVLSTPDVEIVVQP